jgi:starvation-inducible DNA-binding protein
MPKAEKNSNVQMAKHIANSVADTYLLTIKTHGYHWNVTGPNFHGIHVLLEAQYNNLFQAADTLAERIRALDVQAPGSAETFHNHTVVKEASDKPLAGKDMIKDLIKTHEMVRDRIEEGRQFANEIGDAASEDMLVTRLEDHDKMIWMLKSIAA